MPINTAKPLLSVVIPAFNEAGVIGGNLAIVDRYLQGLGVDYEIVVVNDGSTDATLTEITQVMLGCVKVFSYDINRGKGFAVHEGMRIAKGQYRLFMDVDLSTDLNEIKVFLERIALGKSDVLIGDRNSCSLFQQERPWYRALFGYCFASLSSMILGCRLTDFTCGFKMYTDKATQEIFLRQRTFGWAFDAELILIAARRNLFVESIPVRWQHRGNSKVRILNAVIVSFGDLLRIRYNDLMGRYR